MPWRRLAPRDEVALGAATDRTALFGRDDLRCVAVEGKHRLRFLHALLTQDIEGMGDGQVRPSVMCDAQGRIGAVAELLRLPDRVLMWVDRRRAQALVDALNGYKVAERVQIGLDEEHAALELIGPGCAQVLGAIGLTPAPPGAVMPLALAGTRGWLWSAHTGGAPGAPHGPGVPAVRMAVADEAVGELATRLREAGAEIGCHAAREVLRIRAGQPLPGLDLDDGSLPIEAGLQGAVSLSKGCYLGQEAIGTMVWRGRIRRHLCWVQTEGADALAEGMVLRDPRGKRAGTLASGYVDGKGQGLGLAMVSRRSYAPGALLHPEGGGAALTVVSTTVEGALTD